MKRLAVFGLLTAMVLLLLAPGVRSQGLNYLTNAAVRAIYGLRSPRLNGAKGDCLTNDAAAIQAAIDAANVSGGGVVTLPQPPGGCYKTTATITVKPGVTLKGMGGTVGANAWPGVKISSTANPIIRIGSDSANSGNSVLQDLYLSGAVTGLPFGTQTGILLQGAEGFDRFENLAVFQTDIGIDINGNRNGQQHLHNSFRNVVVDTWSTYGIRTRVSNGGITNDDFTFDRVQVQNDIAGGTTGAGWALDSLRESNFLNCRLVFGNQSYDGVTLSNTTALTWTGGILEGLPNWFSPAYMVNSAAANIGVRFLGTRFITSSQSNSVAYLFQAAGGGSQLTCTDCLFDYTDGVKYVLDANSGFASIRGGGLTSSAAAGAAVLSPASIANPNVSVSGLYNYGATDTFTALQTFSGGFTRPTMKIVEVCVAGCKYTTLSSACASETSTAANPILFMIGPGKYTGRIVCSGQDHATFLGAGPASTIIDVAGLSGDTGGFEPGTSTNWTLQGFYIKAHRAIYMDGGGTGGGNIYIRDNVLEQDNNNAQPDQDCLFGKGFAAGTNLWYERNTCYVRADGLTVKADGANISIHASMNTWRPLTCANNCDSRIYAFESSPVSFDVAGDRGLLDRNTAFTFIHYKHTVAGAMTAKATARNVLFRMNDSASNGNGWSSYFLLVDSAPELVRADLIGVDSEISTTDSTTSVPIGVNINNATTEVYVEGGRFRTTGGSARFDFNDSGANKILLNAVDYLTDSGTAVAVDAQRLSAGRGISILDGTDTAKLIMDDTAEGADSPSPPIRMCDATTAAGDNCVEMRSSGGSWFFLDTSGNAIATMNSSPTSLSLYGNVYFNGSSPTINMAAAGAMINTGGNGLGIDCVTTMPACNTAGRMICDGDGTVGMCFCDGATWRPMTTPAADCS